MNDRRASDTTCWTLIRQASSGSEEDRERFARNYLDVVRSYLRSRWKGTRMLGDLDDAVQEVFLECFREGGVLDRLDDRRPVSFRAFFFGVSRNVALRWEKRAGRRRERHAVMDIDPQRLAAAEATQSRVFDREWARALFRQAGELQRERARASGEAALKRVELLELRSGEDLPVRAIAERWGQEARVVHKEYARAREEFEAALLDILALHYPEETTADHRKRCLELIELLGA